MSSLLRFISQRQIGEWAIAYLAGSWLTLQVLQLLWEVFEWPLAPLRLLIGLVALGFPVVLALALRRRPALVAAEDDYRVAAGGRRAGRLGMFALVAIGLVLGLGWTVQRAVSRTWARGEAVLEARRLADDGDVWAAVQVASRARGIVGEHPPLIELLEQISVTPEILSEPSGATVWVRAYGPSDAEWRKLGVTPITNVRLPTLIAMWRFERSGFEDVELVAPSTWRFPGTVRLPSEGAVPDGMVRVPSGTSRPFITTIGPQARLRHSDFYIGRYEVTNSEYLEFVEAGGYEREELWTEPFVEGGVQLSWSDAIKRFTDATGRPGPADWELGRPKEGQESLPVAGVSWYEAAAYAEFRGMKLPTLWHWFAAAGTMAAGSVIPASNFGGDGPAPAGTYQGMTGWGAYDMAGNVREWVYNADSERRYAMGGAWNDPTYFFSTSNVQSAWDRRATNGIRLAGYERGDGYDERMEIDVPVITRDYLTEEPVSDEVFRVYAAQFDYDATPLDARLEATSEAKYGTVEHVSFEGVGRGRIHGYLYLPHDAQPPYQPVILFPGSDASNFMPDPGPDDVMPEFFPAAGRAVFFPVLWDMYSRVDPDREARGTWPSETRGYVDRMRIWVSEFRRSLDYLESRDDIDTDRIGYFGTSWGGRMAAIIPAVEPRLKAVIAISGGLASGRALPEVDQINYVTRVTTPILMLNGQVDPIEPYHSAQVPMYRMLGTDETSKRHISYPGAGHRVPRNEMIRESLDWLDQVLGPVR